MKRLFRILASTIILISLGSLLTGCAQKEKEKENTITVGVIAGPETNLMEVAKDVAKEKYGLNVKIVEFNDYSIPNAALADGSIDANMFQHLSYLNAEIKSKGYKLTPIARTFIYPVGIYSKKIKHLNDLKEGATVAIPNDPSNEARALLLLQQAGLIRLRPDAGVNATVQDIVSNPKHLVFKEIAAAQLPRALDDVDLAVINTNYAMLIHLFPSRDALAVEKADSPYANLVVIRSSELNTPKMKYFRDLVSALHSKEVLEEAENLFKGQAIPAWEGANNNDTH